METKNIQEYYLTSFRKYADFNGRADRTEFWYFVLINFVISILLSYVDSIYSSGSFFSTGFLGIIFSLVILIPSLAVGVRRLHDINKSGVWIFITLIPVIGWVWLLVLYAMEGDKGNNKYGVNPNGINPQDPTTMSTSQEPPQPTN